MNKDKIILNICIFIILLMCLFNTLIIKDIKDEIKKNKYDINNDGKVSAVDYAILKNYVIAQSEKGE